MAIKQLSDTLVTKSPRWAQLFKEEAKIAVLLQHPNVVRTFGACFVTPLPVMIMGEFCGFLEI